MQWLQHIIIPSNSLPSLFLLPPEKWPIPFWKWKHLFSKPVINKLQPLKVCVFATFSSTVLSKMFKIVQYLVALSVSNYSTSSLHTSPLKNNGNLWDKYTGQSGSSQWIMEIFAERQKADLLLSGRDDRCATDREERRQPCERKDGEKKKHIFPANAAYIFIKKKKSVHVCVH